MRQDGIFFGMTAREIHSVLCRWEAEVRARAEGFAKGFAEGFAEGFVEGFAEGRAEVRQSVKQKLLNMGMTLEDAEKIIGSTISTES